MPPAMRSNSYWYAPRPKPTSSRPPVRMSARAISPAARSGLQYGAVMTAVPSRIRRTWAAQCTISTSGLGAIVYSMV